MEGKGVTAFFKKSLQTEMGTTERLNKMVFDLQ